MGFICEEKSARDRGCVKTFGVFGGGQKLIKNDALSRILRQLLQGKSSPDFAYKPHRQESREVFTQPGTRADMVAKTANTFVGDMQHAR